MRHHLYSGPYLLLALTGCSSGVRENWYLFICYLNLAIRTAYRFSACSIP
ncbi:hypothetical protein F9C07_8772 [Aspergillus flavus]|uniref:Lipoprotein n=1 Tax=Aspergillus flavus (strain ATCC 200026 / FGSC A1120 / IAM 13836 / NRRL 3357 / JCM 12722 / SRRC 167) TaxID=332952 RepID=A0A7U2MIU3_ASPFN|nr:hypothetical protein F9C07_8772 [Aspergillus flavus]